MGSRGLSWTLVDSCGFPWRLDQQFANYVPLNSLEIELLKPISQPRTALDFTRCSDRDPPCPSDKLH